jgi:hypothetical protein
VSLELLSEIGTIVGLEQALEWLDRPISSSGGCGANRPTLSDELNRAGDRNHQTKKIGGVTPFARLVTTVGF